MSLSFMTVFHGWGPWSRAETWLGWTLGRGSETIPIGILKSIDF